MQCTRQYMGGVHVLWAAHAAPFSDKKGAIAIFANDACRSAFTRETLARRLLVFRWRLNFFPPPLFSLSSIIKHVSTTKIKSCHPISFYFNYDPYSFDFFIFFSILSFSILFYLIFILNLILILLLLFLIFFSILSLII